MTQGEREQHMAVVRGRDMWRERCERAEAENARLRKALGKVRRTALEKPFGGGPEGPHWWSKNGEVSPGAGLTAA